jgi:hypothetical protein
MNNIPASFSFVITVNRKTIKAIFSGVMKCILSILTLFVFLHLHAQVTIRNMSSLKPDSNLLFALQDNRIKVSGTNQKTHVVSKNGLTISAYDSNTFIVSPRTLTPDTLLVYAGNKLLLKKKFTIDSIPNIRIQLGYVQHDTATIREILANKVLHAAYKGYLFPDPIRILSFSTRFVSPDGDTLKIFLPMEGDMLSKEQVAIIKELKKNSKIIFDDILLVTSNPKYKRRLAPFDITIR